MSPWANEETLLIAQIESVEGLRNLDSILEVPGARDVAVEFHSLSKSYSLPGIRLGFAVGNRDDHLRNHGFVLGQTGWQLAPAFDVNPNIDKAEHVLNIDDSDNRPSLATVLSTAAFYGLTAKRAEEVVEEVATAVDEWEEAAHKAHIASADIELTRAAFAAHASHRQRG